MLTEVTITNHTIPAEWEYMLRNSVYMTLIGYTESTGYSIPCKVRQQMEDEILKKFKSKLFRDDKG